MIYLALGAALFLGWTWMRSKAVRRGGWRVGAGLLSVLLVVVGMVLVIRGDEWVGLPMTAIGIASALGGRVNRGAWFRARAFEPPSPPAEGMSPTDARSILGVEPGASDAEIRAAYSRLMQRAHPDKGGTTGLAAQLNAARDRLLKG